MKRLATAQNCLLSLFSLGLIASTCVAEAADWNQWRGPMRDGIVSTEAWPQQLEGKLNLAWEKPLSPSYSGPVIHNGHVFTTETIDKKFERVTAYDSPRAKRLGPFSGKAPCRYPSSQPKTATGSARHPCVQRENCWFWGCVITWSA